MTSFSKIDHVHMSRALRLAARGMNTTDPNPRVGCVIADGERIIAEDWHRRAGEGHAEVLALKTAGSAAKSKTAYVTLEPCSHIGKTPPCVDALIAAGVSRVVCAMVDPNPKVSGAGVAKLQEAGIAVEVGLMEEQARELNCGFVKRMTKGLPWVRLKLGVSLDGRTALASGQSQWITSKESRLDVQRWRARSSAILTGSGTVLKDDPQLNVRIEGVQRQPWRVVMDSELRVPVDARVFADTARSMVLTASVDAARHRQFAACGIRVEGVERAELGLDVKAALRRLGELEVNEVWVEAGPRLAGALLAARVVDEMVLYVAPQLLGNSARGMFELPEFASLHERLNLKFKEIRNIGADLRIIAHPI